MSYILVGPCLDRRRCWRWGKRGKGWCYVPCSWHRFFVVAFFVAEFFVTQHADVEAGCLTAVTALLAASSPNILLWRIDHSHAAQLLPIPKISCGLIGRSRTRVQRSLGSGHSVCCYGENRHVCRSANTHRKGVTQKKLSQGVDVQWASKYKVTISHVRKLTRRLGAPPMSATTLLE